MRLITGDETGLVKVVNLEAETSHAVSTAPQARARCVDGLAWVGDQGAFACASADSVLSVYAPSEDSYARTSVAELEGRAVAVETCAGGARVATATAEGVVQLWGAAGGGAAAGRHDVGANVRALAASRTDAAVVAVGGTENDVAAWDVERGVRTWRARNVAHDELNLQSKVWVTALLGLDSGCWVSGTAYKQLRVYDPRAQRRPVVHLDRASPYRLTALCAAPATLPAAQFFSGDAAGDVRAVELRMPEAGAVAATSQRPDGGKSAKGKGAGMLLPRVRLTGPAGSVRSMALHGAGSPFVAVVGLDRMARVYDVRAGNRRSGEAVFTAYLKQRLTAVLFDSQGRIKAAAAAAGYGAGGKGEADASSASESESDDDDDDDAAAAAEYYSASDSGDGGQLEGEESDDGSGSEDDSDDDGDGDSDDADDSDSEDDNTGLVATKKGGRADVRGGGPPDKKRRKKR